MSSEVSTRYAGYAGDRLRVGGGPAGTVLAVSRPLSNRAGFVERFAVESGDPGFTVVAAVDGGGGLVGYAYGVAFDPEQW